jgi:hypothetical protein
MVIYLIEAPDGTVFEIEGPEGASEQELQTFAEQYYAARQASPASLAEYVPAALGEEERPFVPSTPERPTPRELSIPERLVGAGEAALTLATGAVGGTAGLLGGLVKGVGQEVISGEYGTREAAERAVMEAQRGAQALTYAPRTEAGQRAVGAVAEAVEPLEAALAPLAPVAAQPLRVVRTVAPAAQAAKAGVQAVAPSGPSTRGGRRRPLPGEGADAGAARTPQEMERRTTARMMPVPFAGPAALTKGQATRNFAQLQFEKEAAKMGELGAPLRERVENQTAVMLQNFDAMIDRASPIATEKRAIGFGVDKALINKANIVKARYRKEYEKAEKAGELAASVDMAPIIPVLDDLFRFEGVAPNVSAARREAERLGIITKNQDGSYSPNRATLGNAEVFRQFVNEATDWMEPRQARLGRKLTRAIDDITEDQGGDVYKSARKMRLQYADEFENVGLTSKLLSTKGKTSERQIAIEDIFDKIVLLSSVDEMNKVRRTLLTAGPEGKQAWADLKAATIRYVLDKATSSSQTDSRGQPLLSPAALNRNIKTLDEQGKLESLFGKKQAQELRDLAELSNVIYTAPPGSINFSNTASALRQAWDNASLINLPVQAGIVLKETAKYVKNRETRKRIREALEEPK